MLVWVMTAGAEGSLEERQLTSAVERTTTTTWNMTMMMMMMMMIFYAEVCLSSGV